MGVAIEIVSTDPVVRLAAARAFAAAPLEWSVTLCEEASGDADVVVCGPGSPYPGDVAFDPADPGAALHEVEACLERPEVRAGAVLVCGAAGGCGTTSVALHLAAAWGDGVCYADLAGGAAERLGLPADARTWLPGDGDVSGDALPVGGGFRVLCAPRPCPAPRHFPLGPAVASFPRLVLDAGARPDLDALAGEVGTAVLVAAPTRPAMTAARELLEACPSLRWAVVTNRCGPGGQLMRSGLETLLGRPLTLELPCCAALRDAEDEARVLDVRRHRWGRSIARLARALAPC